MGIATKQITLQWIVGTPYKNILLKEWNYIPAVDDIGDIFLYEFSMDGEGKVVLFFGF